jgi:hypothetical protein
MKRIIVILLSLLLFSGCAAFQSKKNYTDIFAKSGLDVDADSNNAMDIDYGGTNATSASTARDNLGLGSSATHDSSYFQTALTNPLVQADISDTPTNGDTTHPASSNSVYDGLATKAGVTHSTNPTEPTLLPVNIGAAL